VGIIHDPSSSPAARAIAIADLKTFSNNRNPGEIVYKTLSADELVCTEDGPDGKQHLAPSDSAEAMAAQLRAAGVKVSFGSK